MSLNFKLRTLALGLCVPHRYSCEPYTGRNWQQRMVADAVKQLQEIWKE